MLDATLYLFMTAPWFLIMAMILLAVWFSTRSISVVLFNAFCLSFFAFVDHFEPAMQTFAVILVCTIISALFGIPIGIAMSKYNRLQKAIIPVLDLLQTLPTFVYLIPLIFLFPIGESRLYGIAIILYAIVPVIRLTDLGVRLVDKDVVEAGNAFGMSPRQKLTKVELPLALPNIMAGLNQTIMMSASMVTAPGLGVLVLRGIRNLELGVGLMAGVCIVLLAVMLDRTSKAALSRIDRTKTEL
jgi:glycine betaine/proline transport system permease protein